MNRTWTLLWLASLVLAAVVASALTRAQSKEPPRVISGDDLGFRMESTNAAGEAVGTLVVRVDGRWVPAAGKMGIQRPMTP